MSQRTPAEQIARLRQGVINLPGIGFGSPLVLGLGAAQIAADNLGLSLGQVGALGLVGAAALAAIAIALDNFNKQLEQAKVRLSGALAAQQNYYDALATMTTAEVNAQIATIQQGRSILEQQIAETQGAIDAAIAAARADRTIGAAIDFGPIRSLVTGDLDKALEEQQKQLTETIDTETRLTQGREAGAFAANDAKAAELALADARREAFEFSRTLEGYRTQNQINDAQIVLRAIRMTKEEREAYIDQAQRDQTVLEGQLKNTKLTTEAHEALSRQYNQLGRDIEFLSNIADTYADQLEREAAKKELITDQYDNYLEALDIEAKIRQEIIDTIAKIDEVLAKRDNDLMVLEYDTAERRKEIQQDAADRIEKIAQDSADRIGKIMRDAGREQFAAVAERDALAFYQSQIKAKDALDDQKLADKRAIEQLAKQIAKQEAQLQKSYDKRYQQIFNAASKEEYALRQHLAHLEVDQLNAQNAINAIALNGSGGLVVIQTHYWSEMNRIAVEYAANTVNSVNSIMNGYSGGSNLPGGLPGYQPWGGQGGSLSTAAFNRAVDNRIAQTLSFARTGRRFG